MSKTILDQDQVLKLTELINGTPALLKRMGKDGAQVEAFWLDAKDKIDATKSEADKALIYGALMLVMLIAKDCTRKFSFDPFKPLRLKCDEVARLLNFERYKKLRNL
jgi:hypothetical protein